MAFVVEELRRVGAVVHLAEPAETAGLKGPKKRAKNDRADARHLRELLMIKRLPESWIPPDPDHILDLRARVRLRHTLSEQRSEWQQRVQATLYHHGCPQRRQLMVGDGREWLAAQPLSPAAREQVTVALAMIDGIEAQITPLDKDLRAYARRQAGCKALIVNGHRFLPSGGHLIPHWWPSFLPAGGHQISPSVAIVSPQLGVELSFRSGASPPCRRSLERAGSCPARR